MTDPEPVPPPVTQSHPVPSSRRPGRRAALRLGSALLLGLGLTAFTQAGPIRLGETQVENAYPDQIAFEVEIASEAGAIEQAELHVKVRGDTTTTVLPAGLTAGGLTIARAVWETRRAGIPPGAPYSYRWKIRDQAGNTYQSPEAQGLVLDPTRPWSERKDERVGVWWYEGGPAFGQRIFDLASESLRQMEEESGLALPFRLHVVLYPDFRSFAAWHDYVLDWVAGEAYSAMGLTVQVVAPSDSPEWLAAVICHEVAHLYFHQATYNPLSSGPTTWINEGYAQRHECVPPIWQSQQIDEAMRQGSLIPLRLATGSFSGDDARINLLYAESWSAVEFLYDEWGEQGMSQLLAAFRSGADGNEALLAATGLDFEQFQQAWWGWLGGAPGAYPTPPVAPAAMTATPGPMPTPTLAATPAPPATALEPETTPPPGAGPRFCPSGLTVFGVVISLAFLVPGVRRLGGLRTRGPV